MPTAGTRDPQVAARLPESPVLDVIYLAATLTLFGLVALVAKGAEKL
ncbi:hypothetical protein [Microbacterium sp. TNHR37B]|nr:hypothetical protein [Microbacterium sp. TNHR37B]KZE89624.1 hypothetical protein AVP41_02422 [Microbacterium sp. TNHR37B]